MHQFFDVCLQKDEGIRISKETGLVLACYSPGLIDSLGILQAEQELA